jgi:predicted N-formylglutamate amidohydrolase
VTVTTDDAPAVEARPAGSLVKPFLLYNPRSLSPIVLTCEHATNRMPFRKGVGPEQRVILETHWGWDIGGWPLTLDLANRLDASAVGGRWSRLLIDLNRRVDDPTLLRDVAEGVRMPWNENLRGRDIEERILTYHAPYHEEVDRLILRRLVRGVRPLVFAVHSFTPVFDGRERKFELGILYEHHRGLAHRLGRALRNDGFSVRYNQPYSGMAGMMYAVDRHGSHHRLPCLELEVNHGLFSETGAVERIGEAVARGLRLLIDQDSAG